MTLTVKIRQQALALRKIRLSQRRITSEQALRQCARVASHAGASSRRKSHLLREWCARNGYELGQEALVGIRPVSSGAEHDVFFSDSENRAIKLTRSGGYGHSLVQEGMSALPSEYLLRLNYQNELFGDFIELKGIIYGETEVQILTSQPWITTHRENPTPSEEEIDAYFEELGFHRRDNLPVSAYYNTEMDLTVLDAHSQNILRDEKEELVPIDLVIGHPGEWARKWLRL